jgi:transcriptional regulator GlxA family with amidase domain
MVDVPDQDAPFRAAIDSTLMITIARFGMPVALAVVGWFVTTMLTDLKKGQEVAITEFRDGHKQLWTQVGKLNEAQTSNSISLGTLTSKLDGGLKQLDHLQIQVDSLQRH